MPPPFVLCWNVADIRGGLVPFWPSLSKVCVRGSIDSIDWVCRWPTDKYGILLHSRLDNLLSALLQHKIISDMDAEPNLFPVWGNRVKGNMIIVLYAFGDQNGSRGMTYGTTLLQALEGWPVFLAGLFYNTVVLLLCVEHVEEPSIFLA